MPPADSTIPPPTGLSSHFGGDEWFKFTEDQMDEDLVQTILANDQEPDNAAHATSSETLKKAVNAFMEQNGDALFAALKHLDSRKGR